MHINVPLGIISTTLLLWVTFESKNWNDIPDFYFKRYENETHQNRMRLWLPDTMFFEIQIEVIWYVSLSDFAAIKYIFNFAYNTPLHVAFSMKKANNGKKKHSVYTIMMW